MNYRWKYEPPTAEEKEAAKKLTQEAGVSPTVSLMLIRRGINTPDAVKKYFRPQLQELLDHFLMDDMDVAVERLNDAIGRKERILIYGDYDVDGCTAVALVYRFLQQFYSNVDYYIPDRYEEGYGVSMQSIEYAKEYRKHPVGKRRYPQHEGCPAGAADWRAVPEEQCKLCLYGGRSGRTGTVCL